MPASVTRTNTETCDHTRKSAGRQESKSERKTNPVFASSLQIRKSCHRCTRRITCTSTHSHRQQLNGGIRYTDAVIISLQRMPASTTRANQHPKSAGWKVQKSISASVNCKILAKSAG